MLLVGINWTTLLYLLQPIVDQQRMQMTVVGYALLLCRDKLLILVTLPLLLLQLPLERETSVLELSVPEDRGDRRCFAVTSLLLSAMLLAFYLSY